LTFHVLLGEWWQSNAMFGGVFAVVAIFVFGLAWYVMRGDRLNRTGIDDVPAAAPPHTDEPENLTPAEH
jgi:hypothetical protein